MLKKRTIKSKVILLVAVSVIVAIVMTIMLVIPGYAKALKEATRANMVNYISTYTKSIQNSIETITTSFESSGAVKRMQRDFMGEDMMWDMSEDAGKETLEKQSENQTEVPMMPEQNPEDACMHVISEYPDFMREASLVTAEGVIELSSNEELVGDNILEEADIQAVLDGAGYALSDLDYSDDYGYTFGLSIPLKDGQGEIQAILSTRISVAFLAKCLSDTDEYSEEMFQGMHAECKMKGYDNVSMYLMDSEGQIIVSDLADSVGDKQEEKMIEALEQAKQENTTESEGTFTYTSQDNNKHYTGYSYIEQGGWHLIVEIPYDEVYGTLENLNYKVIFASLLVLLVVILLANMFARDITKPIKQTTEVLHHMAELDFEKIDVSKLGGNADETKRMAESIHIVVDKLSNVLEKIVSSINLIYSSSEKLNDISQKLEDDAKENLSITQELASGMEETIATYETISQNVMGLQENSNYITDKLSNNVAECNQMLQIVQELTKDTEQASKEMSDIYLTVKRDVAGALEQSKQVDKISDMANTIMDIADQTSLLALNAAIEAARAGEAGKGFAVVAEQISHLANQSADNVSNITETIHGVMDAVAQLKKSIETILDFMEQKVLKDYENFTTTSNQYSVQSSEVRNEIEQVQELIQDFLQTLNKINESIAETTGTLEGSSQHVMGISDKNTDLADISSETFAMAIENMDKMKMLRSLVEEFKLKK